MKTISEFMSALRPFVKAIVITVMTLVFSHIAMYDLTSVSFFSPMEKAADFRFSDFYTMVADRGAASSYEKDIVIVPVDGCNRNQMAQTLSDIDFCSPAAVGLDIFFTPLRDSDEDKLSDALRDCDNLVMPVMVDSDGEGLHISHLSSYDTLINPSGGFAAVNIQGAEGEREIVREFRNKFETGDGDIRTLSSAIVAIGFPDAADKLDSRKSESEEIAYASREFEIVYPEELLENQDLIEGRIVFVGKLQDKADQHVTPLNNFTPGLLIHAYIAATILSEDYTRKLSKWESLCMGAILCFLVVWINLHLMQSVMGPLLVRSLQIGLLYFMVVTGTMVYVYFNVDLNFSFSILSVSLGVAACEVYGAVFDKDGLIDYIARKINKLKLDKSEKKNDDEKDMEDDQSNSDGSCPDGHASQSIC